MTNNINQNQKVGNYNEYIHNPEPEHVAENKYTAEEAINDIRQHLDFSDDNYIEKFNEALSDSENISKYIEYVSTDSYMRSHFKSKDDFLFEDTFFNQELEKMADIMLRDYDNQNGEYADYTLMSDYSNEQNEYRNVTIETDADADNVKEGLAIHVDLLDTLHVDQKLELSERVKRTQRYNEVKANIDKYPDLKQMYETWEQMGYNYGFHAAYTKEEKEKIREYWIEKFSKEKDNSYSPQNRMRLIRKHYNQLGYDMHLALESLRNPIYSRPTFNSVQSMSDKNETLELLEDTLDLTNVEHVKAIFEIQKESKKARVVGIDKVKHVNNWYFILNELENKYKPNQQAGGIGTMLHNLLTAVKLSDLEGYQREVVDTIRCSSEWLSSLENDYKDMLLDNPYKMMLKLLEDKHNVKLDMRQLKREINKIAKIIADTYVDVINSRESKRCVTCEIDKMPSAYYERRDECKKCYIESQQVG